MNRITTLLDLGTAALDLKYVVCPSHIKYSKPRLAFHIYRLPGEVIQRLMDKGLFEFQPKKPTNENN